MRAAVRNILALIVAALFLLAPGAALAQGLANTDFNMLVPNSPPSTGGSFPPAGCSTANGVLINNAAPCSAQLTYNPATGAMVMDATVALAGTTAFTINPASASGLLLDAQVGGVSEASISAAGLFAGSGATLTSGPLTLTGNQSAAAWGTAGIRIKGVAATFTDTSTAMGGTVASGVTNALGGNTIAASNTTVTYTNYYSMFLNSPVNGTNVTITNPWALGTNGPVLVALGTITTNLPGLSITGTWNAVGTTFDAPLLINIIPTAAASASRLFDFQQNGVSSFYGDWHGSFYITGNNNNDNPQIQFFNGAGAGTAQAKILNESNSSLTFTSGTTRFMAYDSTSLRVVGGGAIGWSPSTDTRTAADTTLTRAAAGVVALPQIASDAAHTDTTVCQDTTSHGLYAGSGTAGVCLGNVSSIRFKDDWTPLGDGLSVIMALNPGTWRYKAGIADGGARLQVGFLAEDYGRVLPNWTRYDEQGRPNGDDLLAVVPQAVRAIQQLKREFDDYRSSHP